MQNPAESVLYVVATPIGNLGDMTERAREVLLRADLIAAEDTRHTGKLLKLLGIEGKPLISCHDHNEGDRAEQIVSKLTEGTISVALVTDAGTPCISDPGYRVVSKVRAAGVRVVPVPGASAMVALLSVSGLPTDRFMFVGFLPVRKGQLEREIESWTVHSVPVVFFESGPRIAKTMALIAKLAPGAMVAMGRELTKIHEEIITAPVEDHVARLDTGATIKGEIVCMFCPAPKERISGEISEDLRARILDRARRALAEGQSVKDVVKGLEGQGIPKKELYRMFVELRGDAE